MALPDDIRKQIDERLKELEPAVTEYNELLAIRGLTETAARADRRYSSSERQAQILSLIKQNPGLRITDLAALMAVSVPRVVQLINQLEKDGCVERTPDGPKILSA